MRVFLPGFAFKFAHGEFEFTNQPVRLTALEFLEQCPIVPKRSFAPTIEPCPHRFANIAIIRQDGAHIT